jgi:cyclohexyl-isocyanide hydratase
MSSIPPLRIGFLLFSGVTQLDITGPMQVLSRLPGAQVHLAAKTLDPVQTDCGPFVLPSTTLASCPDLDLLCVPGGFGVDSALADDETLAFVRHQGRQAQYVTSVCTGAFLLGAAGLLRGKRATTHWRYHYALERVGAIAQHQRVVRDGNVFTGAGVTAGIDFALSIVAELAGDLTAKAIQLGIEYDPMPPFNTGSPEKSPPDVRAIVEARYEDRIPAFESALQVALSKQ